MPDRIVSGSVIQRTFVGSDLPAALFAASVPVSEIASVSRIESDADIKRLIAEVLAVPSNSLLDDAEYRTLVRKLASQNRRRSWLRYEPFFEDLFFAWERREKELFGESQSNERPIRMFAEHSIGLMVAGERGLTPYWFGVLPAEELRQSLKLETDETAFTTGLACFNARLQRSQRTADFTKSVLEYDLPIGNSPRASSDSLLKLLDSGKKMCLAPMAAGGTYGIAQLSQGQYIAAILSVSAGSAMTLILLGSVAVGSLLVQRVAQMRNQDNRPES